MIEVTFCTKIVPQAIRLVKNKRPEILISAGTVLTRVELKAAIDNGAAFGVARDLIPESLKRP